MHLSLCNYFISFHLLAAFAFGTVVENEKDLASMIIQRDEGPLQIGGHHQISISSDIEISDIKPTTSDDGKIDTYNLKYENASFLSVHFSAFDLPTNCHLEINDGNELQSHTMKGRGKFELGTFWGHHVNGDTMEINLSCGTDKDREQALFAIDEFVAGYNFDDHPESKHSKKDNLRSSTHNEERSASFIGITSDKRKLSICGADDKRNAVCYKKHETIYKKARAVARLYINGSGACTGWLVSGSNMLLTNEHCISSLSDVQNTDFEFMAEEDGCTNTPGDGSWFSHRNSDGIFDGTALLKKSATWDYALVQLSGDPASKFGYLELDNRKANISEEIYIPQHPGGRPKEIGIVDTSQTDGDCKVMGYSRGCAPNDMRYTCDTEGGSSGSPVLSRATNKVIALHHCGGGCGGNLGAPIYEFYDEIADFFSPYAQVSSGSCEAHGLETIESAAECKEAAVDLGRTVTWGPHGGYGDVVTGCSARFTVSNTHLFFNPAGICDPNASIGRWTYTGCKCTDWMPCLCRVPKPRHVEISSDTCETYGFNTINSAAECKEAAVDLGRTVTWGPHGGYGDVVTGCSARFTVSNTHLFFNQAGICDPSASVGRWTYTGCKCADWMPCICQIPSSSESKELPNIAELDYDSTDKSVEYPDSTGLENLLDGVNSSSRTIYPDSTELEKPKIM